MPRSGAHAPTPSTCTHNSQDQQNHSSRTPKQDQRERAGKGRVCHKRKQVTHKKTDNTKQKNMQLARAQHQNSSQEGARKGCLCAGQGGDFFPVCGALFPTPGTLAGVLLFPEASPVT